MVAIPAKTIPIKMGTTIVVSSGSTNAIGATRAKHPTESSEKNRLVRVISRPSVPAVEVGAEFAAVSGDVSEKPELPPNCDLLTACLPKRHFDGILRLNSLGDYLIRH
jgi:hypothetical protein